MKKLSLKPNAFDKGEVLTRAQLRKVMGGDGSGSGSGPGGYYKCCNYQACYSCGEPSWVPSGATIVCNGWVCPS
ncbi:hypothetical protein QFZ20_003887 [Flavobacterium sp. W4I14]|nr:hypothetical protein [Flavobacterium sp. W4I14]